MLLISVGLLTIMLVSGRTIPRLPKSIIVPEMIFEWADKMYEMIDEHGNGTHEEMNTLMLENVKKSSNQMHILSDHVKIKCYGILQSSFANLVSPGLYIPELDLCKYIHNVDHFFELSVRYESFESIGNQTLQNYGHNVLWGDTNLPDSLEDIQESLLADRFSSGLLRLLYQHSTLNLQFDCDTHASAQQQVYYIYVLLILSEIKGILTFQQIYLTKRLAIGASHDYVAELDFAKKNFETRVKAYHTTFVKDMDRFSKHVRRCDVRDHKRDVIELQKYSRLTFGNAAKSMVCFNCPLEVKLAETSVNTGFTMYNCSSLVLTAPFCPKNSDSNLQYLWWKEENGIYYGHNTSCNETGGSRGGVITTPSDNNTTKGISSIPLDSGLCACSIDDLAENDDKTSIWRISVTEQISDVSNNMIVTGVKFVTYDNALHLQIQQANFSFSGLLDVGGIWKQLHTDFSKNDTEETNVPMSYEPLGHNRKTLYLDDLKAPEGTVVTGVRFHSAGNFAFKLQIQATRFEFGASELLLNDSTWVDASTNPMRPKDYERQRVEINLNNSDDPSKCTQFDYDSASNKLATFTHTDIHKNGGQTTIPLLDAQPVITEPPFPLSGIGLSYRGKDGFGGYIAPRIYTVGVTEYMKSVQQLEDD